MDAGPSTSSARPRL